MLTPDEKAAVRLVAAARGVTESDLLRDNTLTAVLREYRQLKQKLEAA